MTNTSPDQKKKRPARRTQSERSETTQRKIINSALRLLQKEGFQKANLQEIARGAKVTLGAVQHHFGTRQALMERVIDEVMAPLGNRGAVWPTPGLPLEERAREFVSRAWETIYGVPGYLAAWSLFFGCKSSPALFKRIDAKRSGDDSMFFARLLDHFPEIVEHHPNPQHFACLVFATLRGMAVFRLFSMTDDEVEGQLDALVDTIIRAGKDVDAARAPVARRA